MPLVGCTGERIDCGYEGAFCADLLLGGALGFARTRGVGHGASWVNFSSPLVLTRLLFIQLQMDTEH